MLPANSKMDKISNIVDVHYSNVFVMDSGTRLKLGEYIKKIRQEKDLSVENVARQSGGGISGSYVNKIENENVNPTTPKLKALAKGLGVTETEIFAVARGVSIEKNAVAVERFARIADDYALLPDEIKKNIEPLIVAIELTISRAGYLDIEGEKPIIPTITLDEAKADDKKKKDKKKDIKKK